MARPPGIFADLGAGEGDLAREAARLGYRALAIDLAAPPARTGVERARGTLEALPLPSSCARVVAMSASLHYARDPELAAEHTRRAIRVAGGTGPLATGYRHLVAAHLRAAFDQSGFTLTECPRVLGIGRRDGESRAR